MIKGTMRNFDCPFFLEPCTDSRCRRDKCIEQVELDNQRKVEEGLDELEQRDLRELYEALGFEVRPGERLTRPTVGKNAK